MIQDIAPHVFRNSFQVRRAQPEDHVLYFRGRELLLADDPERVPFPKVSEMIWRSPLIFLFMIDNEAYYLSLDEKIDIPAGFSFHKIRGFRFEGSGPKASAFAAVTGYQLNNWYRDNRFCSYCGTGMEINPKAREIICPKCGRIVYPKIVPAVIVGVIDGDRILVTRYANGREGKGHALIAGFTEIGETLEETVSREVMEEVGIRVKNIRYYKSQPWGIVDDLLAGFFCEPEGSTEIRLDRTELREGVWLRREEIPDAFDDVSLTNEMICLFRDGKI